jgi:hypothetical protein
MSNDNPFEIEKTTVKAEKSNFDPFNIDALSAKAAEKAAAEAKAALADVNGATQHDKAPAPKRLHAFSQAVFTNIKVEVLIPLALTETVTEPQKIHAENIITSVAKFLSCRVFDVKIVNDYIRLDCSIPPTLTVEKLVGRIQHEMIALWLATYRKPIAFAGGYCADSQGISEDDLKAFLASQK